MPYDKKADLEKQAWAWITNTLPEDVKQQHLELAYRIGRVLKRCKNCKKNCPSNPRCLTGLGEDSYFKSQPLKVDSIENSLDDLREPSEYVGLVNLGATCYVNSLIQVWFHNEDMRKIIYKWNIENDADEKEKMSKESDETYSPVSAVGQLQYIFAMMQFGNHKYLDPINLAVALGLELTTQQDAQEFSKLLLNHIEGKFQQNAVLTHMLQKLTQGRYNYINCCKACGTEHKTLSTFYELDLQLAPTLNEAIEKFLGEEQLTGANQYHCRVCNSKQDARRFIRLHSLPDTLNIQLLRFVFQRISVKKKKLSASMQFPEILDMSEFLQCAPKTHMFRLVAMLNHKGNSAHSGHFSANICNNNSGEWYEFSDDKVEKMQSNRMEDDTIQENGKNQKRARIPKGYFSSNTAYMLVYKRISPGSDNKRGIKKGMHNNIYDHQVIDPSVNLIRDNSVALKGKRNLKENSLEQDVMIVEKKTKFDINHQQQKDNHNCFNSENTNSANSTIDKINQNHSYDDKDVDMLDCTEEIVPCKYENDSISLNNESNSTNLSVKRNIKENSMIKVEKDTNHQKYIAVSCNQREKFHQVEFEKWGLTSKMQYLVNRDNAAHELHLIAQQQGKEKELEEQNDKRNLVRALYSKILNNNTPEKFYWIPTEWLSNWLKGSRKTDQDSPKKIPPIDCRILMCPHGKMDPLKVNKAKCLPHDAAVTLYTKYGGKNELTENSLCSPCVQKQCKILQFKETLEKHAKELSEIMKNFKQLHMSEGYIVGAESFRCWKKKALNNFLQIIDNNAVKIEDLEEPMDEDEEDLKFNEDLLCEHNTLRMLDSKTKIVPTEAWIILKEYFPNCTEYRSDAQTCFACAEDLEAAKTEKENVKEKAKIQKDVFLEFYTDKNRNKILDSLNPHQCCYIIEKGFVENWKAFIKRADSSLKHAPLEIQNSTLLCQSHKNFLHILQTTPAKEYSIVTEPEWELFKSYYETDFPIKIIKEENGQLRTEPITCEECMLDRLEQERVESLKYDKATIYVKRVEENENANGVDPLEATLNSNRPSRRGRKIKGSHELQVSSEQTLKDLKLMTMEIYHAGPYDQHIYLENHELVDDMSTLATLGIHPFDLLKLKIDTPVETSDTEYDAVTQDYISPEKGFKGTELAG